MGQTNGLGRRLDRLEDQALGRAVHDEAERIAAQTGADPDWLVKRAVDIAELVAIHGRERAIELVAVGAGVSAEQLEASAALLASHAS